MDETEQLAQAQQDAQAREAFLAQNDEFIRRCASKAAGRFVDEHDDAYSEALIAFNNAVTAYRPEKGAFYALAATAIRNRVTDFTARVQEQRYCSVQCTRGTERPRRCGAVRDRRPETHRFGYRA